MNAAFGSTHRSRISFQLRGNGNILTEESHEERTLFRPNSSWPVDLAARSLHASDSFAELSLEIAEERVTRPLQDNPLFLGFRARLRPLRGFVVDLRTIAEVGNHGIYWTIAESLSDMSGATLHPA